MRSYECNGEGRPNGDHCCYLRGVECPHLLRNEAGRKYACGLMVKYGDWDAMEASSEYAIIGARWEAIGVEFDACRNSDPAFCCRPEFKMGRTNQNQSIGEAI